MTTTRPERLSPELVAEVQSWLDQDPDEATRTELSDVLVRAQSGEAEAIVAVESAFAGPLTFGTAGLRAALGPGPSRMNRVVVQRAAAGRDVARGQPRDTGRPGEDNRQRRALGGFQRIFVDIQASVADHHNRSPSRRCNGCISRKINIPTVLLDRRKRDISG